jgi:hypothetical protein
MNLVVEILLPEVHSPYYPPPRGCIVAQTPKSTATESTYFDRLRVYAIVKQDTKTLTAEPSAQLATPGKRLVFNELLSAAW